MRMKELTGKYIYDAESNEFIGEVTHVSDDGKLIFVGDMPYMDYEVKLRLTPGKDDYSMWNIR